MSAAKFDDLTDVYEAMIDWPKRLAHEEPFYRRLFARIGVRSVIDVACGTGRHAALFRSWNLRVEAADVSAGMIDRAAPPSATRPSCAGACGGSTSRWRRRALRRRDLRGKLAGPGRRSRDGRVGPAGDVRGGPPRRRDRGPPAEPLAAARRSLRLAEVPPRRIAAGRSADRQGRASLRPQRLRGVAGGRSGRRRHSPRASRSPFSAWRPRELEQMAIAAGAAAVRFFGGYDEKPYRREQSADLLMVADK